MPRPITLPEPWRTWAFKIGGVEALAKRLGASIRSVHRWAHGKAVPLHFYQAKIDALKKELDAKKKA